MSQGDNIPKSLWLLEARLHRQTSEFTLERNLVEIVDNKTQCKQVAATNISTYPSRGDALTTLQNIDEGCSLEAGSQSPL